MNLLYKLYEFQYLFFRKKYKKNERKELLLHVSITFSILIFMPFWTIILTVDLVEKLFPSFYSLNSLGQKIVIFPFLIILLIIFNKFVIKRKFHKRIYEAELNGVAYSNYSMVYKICMWIVMILIYLSAGYLPIIFYEMGVG